MVSLSAKNTIGTVTLTCWDQVVDDGIIYVDGFIFHSSPPMSSKYFYK